MASGIFERPPRSNRRVVVTGIGVVSPLGLNLKDSWVNVVEGKSGIDRIATFNPDEFDCQIAGEVRNFNVDNYVHKKEQKKMDTFIYYAMAASQMAVEDCGVNFSAQDPTRVGV